MIRKMLLLSLSVAVSLSITVLAYAFGFSDPGGYGMKIYRVESIFYPFVQVYFRTFNQEQQPLVNLNEMNIGLMVKGKSYDPMKRQYFLQTIRHRKEAIRSVLVLDASKSMAGIPFEEALRASARYIDSKRPQDEIAVLAIRDTKEGYDIVSNFERDPGALGRRLADVRADGNKTRLYDAIGAAIQMCGMTDQGSVVPDSSSYIISCSVVVFSDGRDDGSALSRRDLNNNISDMEIPIPVYSLAFSKQSSQYFKNLEAISKNSFGVYYLIGETVSKMQRVVEDIQNILQSDYVVTFRSNIEPDGERHIMKLAVEYPSGSRKYRRENTHFEAIEPPPVPELHRMIEELSRKVPVPPDNDPFFTKETHTAENK